MSVVALVPPSSPVADAVAAQERPPGGTVADAGLARGHERALAGGADWVWVLDGSVTPRPGALAALVDAAERLRDLDPPRLLAGVVIGADGEVDQRRSLWFRRNQIDLALSAAAQRVAPIRAAAGSVLVARGAVATVPPPPTAPLDPGALLEWTAQILRAGTGYLAADSASDAVPGARDPVDDPATAARLFLGGALRGLDRFLYGFELVAERRRPAATPATRLRSARGAQRLIRR
jgi:hypothetical protein